MRFVAVCFMFLLAPGLKSHKYRVKHSEAGQWFYSMVVDAGSKGSRLVIFKWQPETTLPREKIQTPITVGIKSVNPGLASSALDPESVREPLKELIDFAMNSLEPLKPVFHLIPLYLKATAGLRDLIPSARDAVMRATVEFLATYSPFKFGSNQALVISGEEEGAYAWLAVNALQEVLGTKQGKSTYGVIDLGGASLQVAFVPEVNHYVLQNCYPISLTDETNYRLYSKSYLHYGIVEANRRVASAIITENILKVDSVSVIEHPCYYKGLLFSPDFATPQYKIPIMVNMTGTGNFVQCYQQLMQLFRKDDVQCWVRDCTFDGVYQPRLDTRPFVGIGNIGKLLKVVGVPEKSSLKKVREMAANICEMPFSKVEDTYKDMGNRMRKNLCFSISYVYTLLTFGLGFTISDVNDHSANSSQIIFNDSLGGTKVDWALGAMIWEANQQPPSTIDEYLRATIGIETSQIHVLDGDIAELPENDLVSGLPDIKANLPEGLLDESI